LFRLLFLLQAFVLLINPKLLLHLDGNIGNILQKLLIILCGAALMATRPVHRGVVVLIGAIVVLTLLCAMGSEFPQFQWRLYVGGVVSIVAPFVLLTAAPRAPDRVLGLVVFASLPLLMTALGGIYQLAGIAPLFSTETVGGTRLSGTQGIPAFLAAASFTATFAALELAERRHLGYAFLFLADLIILLLAGGRMAFGAAVLVCGIDYLRSFKRIPLLKFFMPIWTLVVGGILLAAFAQDNLRHLHSTSLNREVIWAPLIRQLHAHPWFGVGLGNQQLLLHIVGAVTTMAGHNEYLRLAVELGYPGAVLFFSLTLGIMLLVWNSAWVGRDPMFLVCAAAFYMYGVTDNTFSLPQAYFILAAASFAGRPLRMHSSAEAFDAAAPHPATHSANQAQPKPPRTGGPGHHASNHV
jgi:O-antigen ligase